MERPNKIDRQTCVIAVVGLLASLVSLSAGCTMCSSSDHRSFSAYGGLWQRTVRDQGRVGSVIDPAGARVDGGGDRLTTPSESTPEFEPKSEQERANEEKRRKELEDLEDLEPKSDEAKPDAKPDPPSKEEQADFEVPW
jgi:hypothetical protein